MNSYDIIANAVREYWKRNYPTDVVAFFYQKYEFERDDEWEWCEELIFPQGSDNWETVIFQNDFCEGQTCVKDITIVELEKITSYYAENVITT